MVIRIYRGFRDPQNLGDTVNPFFFEDRSPKTLPENFHALCDEWFFQKFGQNARKRSLMCSTDIEQAKSYSPYIYDLRPHDPSTLIYSPYVRDFIEIYLQVEQEVSEKTVWSVLQEAGFRAVSRIDDISADHSGEVMLCCKTFTVLEPS